MEDPFAKYADYNHALNFAGAHLRDNSVRASAYDMAHMLQAYGKAMVADVKAMLAEERVSTTATKK